MKTEGSDTKINTLALEVFEKPYSVVESSKYISPYASSILN